MRPNVKGSSAFTIQSPLKSRAYYGIVRHRLDEESVLSTPSPIHYLSSPSAANGGKSDNALTVHVVRAI
jgi:hypothetical protein